ncbi:MAG TPA: urea transporter [Daejeonella sp.]|nr:urea transporter [Daejeonella sp.]
MNTLGANLKKEFFVSPYLRGVGQIMLQRNRWTGLLFLVGIFVESITMGIAAVLAVITGTLTAKFLKYDAESIKSGLYGFSATLVGIAMIFHFKPSAIIWMAIIIGSILAAIIQNAFIVRKIPGFTFPFVLVTWVFLFLFHHLFPVAAPERIEPIVLGRPEFFTPVHGFSEVMFIGNDVSGLLFFAAVFINSPIAALNGVFGSLVGDNLADSFKMPENQITEGLFSFNTVLSAITFSGPKRMDGVFVLVAVVLAVLIQIGMQKLNLTVLTFPFVLSVWITHFLKKAILKV